MQSTTSSFSNERHREGILNLIFGLFVFSFQDMIIKSFADTYNVLQLVFLRSIIAFLILVMCAIISRGVTILVAKQPLILLAKGGMTFFAFLSYYLAIPALPLADIVAIAFTSPILVTVFSVLILKESVGPRRWLAIIVGFIGVLFVVGPNANTFNLGIVFAFVCAITYAISSVMTRFIDKGDPPITIAIYSMLAFIILSSIGVVTVSQSGLNETSQPALAFLFREWHNPDLIDGLLIFAIGIIATVGFYCLGRAYLVAPASRVAPFEYTYIIWAVVLAYLFFDEIPKATTILGIIVVIASSLYIWYRENYNDDSQEAATVS